MNNINQHKENESLRVSQTTSIKDGLARENDIIDNTKFPSFKDFTSDKRFEV